MFLSEMFKSFNSSREGFTGKHNMKFANIINEARQTDLEYKEKKVKDVLDRVTVTLGGHYSGLVTKIVKEYIALEDAIEELNKKRNELNVQMKEEGEFLFNAEDEVLTRVIDTVSATLTISKKIVDKKESFDVEKAFQDLTALVPELKDKVDEIIKANTSVSETLKSPRLTVKRKVEEDVSDDRVDQLVSNFENKVTNYVRNWSESYGQKLQAILAQVQ